MGYKLVKRDDRYDLYDESTGQKIASNLMQGNGLKLSTKNCEAVFNGYDLDELFESVPSSLTDTEKQKPILRAGFIVGFQKALEILGDKKFSEDELYHAFLINSVGNNNTLRNFFEKRVLPMFQQTELDVIIQLDDVLSFEANQNNARFNPNFGEYLLDSEGCLILKRK